MSIQDYAISNAEKFGYGYREDRSSECECDACHEPLYEGETATKILGFVFCESCIEEGTMTL